MKTFKQIADEIGYDINWNYPGLGSKYVIDGYGFGFGGPSNMIFFDSYEAAYAAMRQLYIREESNSEEYDDWAAKQEKLMAKANQLWKEELRKKFTQEENISDELFEFCMKEYYDEDASDPSGKEDDILNLIKFAKKVKEII